MSLNWSHILAVYDERINRPKGQVYPKPSDSPTTWDVYAEVLKEHDPQAAVELAQYRDERGNYNEHLDIHFLRGANDMSQAVRHIVHTREDYIDAVGNPGMPVYRGLGFKQDGKMKWQDRVHYDNIGSCWAFDVEATAAYQSAYQQGPVSSAGPLFLIIVHGYVKLDDINWSKTLYNNAHYPQEHEIRLLPGAIVNITAVGTSYEIENPTEDSIEWERLPYVRHGRVHMECGHDEWRPRK
jgi:hypothetical protein